LKIDCVSDDGADAAGRDWLQLKSSRAQMMMMPLAKTGLQVRDNGLRL
jgi:hypothetical protein